MSVRGSAGSDRLSPEAACREAVRLRPDDPGGHFDLGLLLQRQGRHAEAEASYRRALELRPDDPEALNNLGTLWRDTGRDGEAEALFRQALRAKPDYVEALYNLAFLHRFLPGDPLLAALERALARQPKGAARIHLMAALGKAHEDLGEHERAFAYYRAANREKAGGARFDATAQRAQVEDVKRAFPRRLSGPAGAAGALTPVFVVGLPRAGKTLIESLLARHPAVAATGEGREWLQALDRVRRESGIAAPFPACVAAMPPERIGQIGRHCLDALRRRQPLPGIRYVVNTLPGHYRHLGLIFCALPGARVVHCVREPLDHCLAIYFKIFEQGHLYACDLESIAAVYLNYREMMDHWTGLYGERILTVPYEALVGNPAVTARRLYAHCGLDPEAAPAGAELRTDEIGRARPYARQLAPVAAALGL